MRRGQITVLIYRASSSTCFPGRNSWCNLIYEITVTDNLIVQASGWFKQWDKAFKKNQIMFRLATEHCRCFCIKQWGDGKSNVSPRRICSLTHDGGNVFRLPFLLYMPCKQPYFFQKFPEHVNIEPKKVSRRTMRIFWALGKSQDHLKGRKHNRKKIKEDLVG